MIVTMAFGHLITFNLAGILYKITQTFRNTSNVIDESFRSIRVIEVSFVNANQNKRSGVTFNFGLLVSADAHSPSLFLSFCVILA